MPPTPASHEVTGEPIQLRWRTFDLTLPASLDDCDVAVLEAFEDGKAIRAARAILGDEQWATIKAGSLKVRDFGELADAIGDAMGMGRAGE